MFSGRIQLKVFCSLSAAAALALLTLGAPAGLADGRTGDVYVLTNQAAGNSVMVFHRDSNGRLTFVGSVASGGNGAGTGPDPLGSQNPVVLNGDHRLLFTVNAGSDSISVFAVSGDSLALLNSAPSGGTRPVSIAVKHDLVYVLNAGGTPNISGFRIAPETNRLVPLSGSTQDLPGGLGSAPAQVAFGADGGVLVVTEKSTDLVDTFILGDDGVAHPGVSFPSGGATPFGFAVTGDDVAIVSDASGGASGTSALSSYRIDEDENLEVVTPAVGDTQKAACSKKVRSHTAPLDSDSARALY